MRPPEYGGTFMARDGGNLPIPERSRGVFRHRRRPAVAGPTFERLEGRRLLSFLQPYGSKFRRVQAGGVVDVISVSGPGQVFTARSNRGMVAIRLVGTTQDSQVVVSPLGARSQDSNRPLRIGKLEVRSGRLGSFQALTSADLEGRLTPLTGPVASLQFDSLGPSARIEIDGNLGQLSVNRSIDLGQSGRIIVSNDLTGSLSVSQDLTLAGGQIEVGQDLAGSVTIGGSLAVADGGQFSVGRNLGLGGAGTASPATALSITGNLSVDSHGGFTVGGNAGAISVAGNVGASDGGRILVGGNLTSLTTIGGGGTAVTGNAAFRSGAAFTVDGNLGTLSIGSNLQTSGGGQVVVRGNLGVLSITGMFQGAGSEDIVVGDNLGQLTVLGSASAGFSLQNVGIDVAGSIQGVDVRNGISHGLITAGVVIDGGTPGAGSNNWNIGPSGTVAVLDSQIRAGLEIRNFTIGGDVRSDLPSQPSTGAVTRIVAGEDRNGHFTPGGIIDKFQIVGRLIDAALAASVQPFGGTGVAPPTPTPPGYVPPASASDDAGFKTYDEPAGTITVGTLTYPNATAPPYDPSSDPTIDDLVLPGGSINPSFAPGSASSAPTNSTVLGGVVSTSHGDNADFAGIFAADTRGVFVGPLPTQ